MSNGFRLDLAVQPSKTNRADRRDEGDTGQASEGHGHHGIASLCFVGLSRALAWQDRSNVGNLDVRQVEVERGRGRVAGVEGRIDMELDRVTLGDQRLAVSLDRVE